MKILIAEDDKTVRELLVDIVRLDGHAVVIAKDGLDALHKFIEHQGSIDLVLTDYKMPKVTGSTLAHHVRTVTPEVPVIMVTGYASKFTEEQAALEGIKHYMKKPLNVEALRAAIHSLRKAIMEF